MIRVVVLSDSHGDEQAIRRVLRKEAASVVIHLGDGAAEAMRLAGENPLQTWHIVRGNCDGWGCPYQEEMVLPIGGVTFMVTHGHRYGVKRELDLLADSAVSKGAQIVCFGHTHTPYCAYHQGVLLLNPGSCAYTSRCAVITVDDRGEYTAELL